MQTYTWKCGIVIFILRLSLTFERLINITYVICHHHLFPDWSSISIPQVQVMQFHVCGFRHYHALVNGTYMSLPLITATVCYSAHVFNSNVCETCDHNTDILLSICFMEYEWNQRGAIFHTMLKITFLPHLLKRCTDKFLQPFQGSFVSSVQNGRFDLWQKFRKTTLSKGLDDIRWKSNSNHSIVCSVLPYSIGHIFHLFERRYTNFIFSMGQHVSMSLATHQFYQSNSRSITVV